VKDENIQSEFSRPIRTDQLNGRREFDIEAQDEERQRLAARMNVSCIDWLRAHIALAPWKGRVSGASVTGVIVTGHLEAQIIQPCSVTLDPVIERIEEDIKYKYINELNKIPELKSKDEVILDFEQEEPPENLIGGQVDVGEIVAEALALAINPYPRGQGVQFEALNSVPGFRPDSAKNPEIQEHEHKKHPFSVLSKLKPHAD